MGTKKIHTIFFILFLQSVLIFSCSSKHKQKSNLCDTSFVNGKVNESVQCCYDRTNSYALFLPSGYDKNKKWPVIYFFDPHGKGSFPLNKYDSIANVFGFILIGSNNSKNGLLLTSVKTLFDTLYADSRRRLSIDDNRVYAAGFSGGSRVASYLASFGKIKSVIGCGASMSRADISSSNKFGYFGIAGNKDFNRTEFYNVKEILDSSLTPHCIMFFNGTHEWPPDSLMAQAFLWTDLFAVKKNFRQLDTAAANPFFRKWNKEIEDFKSKNPYKAYLICEKMISFFEGIMDVSSFKTLFTGLEKNTAIIAYQENQQKIIFQESALQSEYANSISTEDTLWWSQQVDLMNGKIKASADEEISCMYERVLNYLSLVAYMNADNAIKSADYKSAEKYVKIYSLVDPENPEHAYMKALLLLKKNKMTQAVISLRNAAKLGFSEPDRLESDTVMERIRSQSAYPEILETVKSNAAKQK